MPQPNSSQTMAFFMIALWLAVKNPSLKITNPKPGATKITGIPNDDLPDFLTQLSAIAEGAPDLEVAKQLYRNVLDQLPDQAQVQVNVQLEDQSWVLASISYAEALRPVHELIGRIARGDLAVRQVADYDPMEGCRLAKIEGVTR
jgi:hypothetical protein